DRLPRARRRPRHRARDARAGAAARSPARAEPALEQLPGGRRALAAARHDRGGPLLARALRGARGAGAPGRSALRGGAGPAASRPRARGGARAALPGACSRALGAPARRCRADLVADAERARGDRRPAGARDGLRPEPGASRGQARGRRTPAGRVESVGPPFRIEGTPLGVERAASAVNEDAEALLGEVGLTPEEIRKILPEECARGISLGRRPQPPLSARRCTA